MRQHSVHITGTNISTTIQAHDHREAARVAVQFYGATGPARVWVDGPGGTVYFSLDARGRCRKQCAYLA